MVDNIRSKADFLGFLQRGRVPRPLGGLRGDFGVQWWRDFILSLTDGTSDIPGLIVTAGGGGGGGEANTSSNAGAGVGLANAKVGVDLPFRSLVAGTNIILTPAADTVTIDASGSGGIVQQVAYVSDNVTRNLGSTLFPQDDTIPQISEGEAYSQLDIVYTALDAANILHVQAQPALNSDAVGAFLWNTGLYRSDQTDAIGFEWGAYPTTGVGGLIVDAEVVAGVITPITYSVRVGINVGNAVVQGDGTNRLYGGAMKSWHRIIERTP